MTELSGPLYAKGRTLLRLIKGSGSAGISRAAIMDQMSVKPQGVGGMMGGMSKAAKRAGLSPHADGLPEILIQRSGDTYIPGPLLLENDLPEEQ